MMKWALVVLMFMAVPARADDAPNCKDPQDQNTMTQCAGLDFENADKALNEIWPKLKSDAQASDEGTGNTEYADALLASQRAWIAFRGAECTWQAMEMHGGSGEPMLLNGCEARLTNQRIKQLQTGASE
ncbi:MAG: lysozyme inhibitor LprI family protein [Aestuariivirga sp.]